MIPQSFTAAARSRGLASLPVRRPRRFWDFHVPNTAWDYRPRITLGWKHTITRQHERDLAVRDWVTIPDARLPGPWTCNWSHWPYWTNMHALEAVLSTRYALANEPLNPIMFNSFDETTVFACAKTRTFYLYHGPHQYGEYEEMLYAFDGVFSSVAAFIEEADWNQVEQVKPIGSIIDPDLNRHEAGLPTPIYHIRKDPVVYYAKVPHCCRGTIFKTHTLGHVSPSGIASTASWVPSAHTPQGTFMYQPCRHDDPLIDGPSESYRIHEWPYIPDTKLPEPWSCDWPRFVASLDWYDVDQETALKQYGPELVGFVPALYVPLGPWRRDTVMCPPGGAGTYYVWYHEDRDQAGPWGPWMGDMQRFEGVYASLEHFIQMADWNRLEGVAYREPVSYD
ncbi:hypothetical protein C8R44DRAFT_739336 [Mycena epipterygia]|nr:hypothetical protein C8R44DRAFT_739336 [Mycena epipterygia]